ncbi:MAG: sirohydrochlorin chelatase [Cyanobacteria bacterium]|nr:sirohydrochlorin chelatase [Cyanobacteria bacterium CG_2015-16_32_12]NCO78395.1 sirohydrochlorin chelatase [Cyanobacteria bacterium CG_2015-22_32_23]NCQ02964.1 sirohydrochlorin chelatase [Cyanobacteria bacterium CG_2015-09_32_10]NCQ41620.1 sirohydrochlorin chelatase [Cyanobacteria bacterium CG_2015-04_32_10]NCS85038.1 sirohydrochlorin chelatase [Cyanobacteria bacterium CG_2015-02_32_10]
MIAYIFVVHGSRNPNYRHQLHKLTENITKLLSKEGFSPLLTTAYLELENQPLSFKISDFAQECAIKGYATLKILPLFLLSGTHVLQDIPQQVEIARLSSSIPLELMPHLGKSEDLMALLQNKYQQQPTTHRILLSHGTSITQGNQEIKAIAQKLNANIAYWSIFPYFANIIDNLLNYNPESIAIVPYFLFSGKITETIEQEIVLRSKNTKTKLIFIPPFGATKELAQVIVKQVINN